MINIIFDNSIIIGIIVAIIAFLLIKKIYKKDLKKKSKTKYILPLFISACIGLITYLFLKKDGNKIDEKIESIMLRKKILNNKLIPSSENLVVATGAIQIPKNENIFKIQ